MEIFGWILICVVISVLSISIGYALTGRFLEGEDKRRIGPWARMGTGTWKFTESWASTITASGAVLGLVLAAQVLPDQTQIPRGTYVFLNLIFAAIVVAATLLYNAIRWPERVTVTNNVQAIRESKEAGRKVFLVVYEEKTTTENWGFVSVFLLASALILWAVLGQLATTWFALEEIDSLPPYVDTILAWLIPMLGVLTAIYVAVSVPWTLINQARRGDEGKEWILP